MRDSHFNRIRESMNFENRDSMLSEKIDSRKAESDIRKVVDSTMDELIDKCTSIVYETDFASMFERMGYDSEAPAGRARINLAKRAGDAASEICEELVQKMGDDMLTRKLVDKAARTYFR